MVYRILSFLLACVFSAGAADLTGKWNVTATAPGGGERKAELQLANEGGKLTGSMSTEEGSFPIEDVKLAGDELSYRVASYTLKFTVAESAMRGKWTSEDGATGPVSATRATAAAGGVSGKWKGQAKSSAGRDYNVVLEVAEENGKISGTLGADEGSVPIQDAKVERGVFSFSLTTDEGTYRIKLTVSGSNMKGAFTGPGGETGNVSLDRT